MQCFIKKCDKIPVGAVFYQEVWMLCFIKKGDKIPVGAVFYQEG